MSGYLFAVGNCFVCRHTFSFNPEKVPSYQGEPICKDCIWLANTRRKWAGLPLWPVLPGAYDPEETA